MGEFAVEVVVVETVADNEVVVDGETGVVGLELDGAVDLFVEQDAGADRMGSALEQELLGEGEGVAGVEDVVDHQHVGAGEVFADVVDDFNRAGRRGARAIAGEGEEIDARMDVVAVEAAHEIGQEHEAALEDADHDEVAGAEVLHDFINEVVDALGNGSFIDQDFFYIVLAHGVASGFEICNTWYFARDHSRVEGNLRITVYGLRKNGVFEMKVRTRFAPSPTGHVHIGNMRAAIYNWLFARHHGGEFLLRVEDTDRERSTAEAIQTLLDAMAWFKLDVDGEPLYQSTRMEAHLAAAEELLAKGLAYKEDKGGLGKGECVIFKMPGHNVSFADGIKGTLSKAAENMQDFVIVRSNGTPVFHLANVLDDIEQGITHVIRGDDHIENTYRHIALYQALGADVPHFAHLPMIVNAQGKPYSKRDGDAFVGDFKDKGFLADTMFNYLALCGWSPGDDREVMTRDEMVEAFELARCQSSPAQVDLKKLTWMNGEYMLKLPADEFETMCFQALEEAGIEAEADYAKAVFGLVRERVKTAADIVPMVAYFFNDDFAYDEKAVRKKLQKDGVAERLVSIKARLEGLEVFDAASTDQALHDFVEESGLGFGAVMPPVRIAVSGMQSGPDLFPLLGVLGRERVLERIDRTLSLHLS